MVPSCLKSTSQRDMKHYCIHKNPPFSPSRPRFAKPYTDGAAIAKLARVLERNEKRTALVFVSLIEIHRFGVFLLLYHASIYRFCFV